MKRQIRWMIVTLLVLIAVGGLALITYADCTCLDADCFENIVVTQAGVDAARGTYRFAGSYGGKPFYENTNRGGVAIRYNPGRLRWMIEEPWGDEYYESGISTAGIPPSSGWRLAQNGDIPLPKLSGGDDCGAPPELTLVDMQSYTCCSGEFVSADTRLELYFEADRMLAISPLVTILGHPVTPEPDWFQKGWRARYQITPEDPEGEVTFTIDYTSQGGLAGPQVTAPTEDVLPFYDKTPPTVPIPLSPADGAVLTSNTVQLYWTESTDSISDRVSYDFCLNPVTPEVHIGKTLTRTLSGLAEGTYTWYVVALDGSRNESPAAPRTFTIDMPDGNLVVTYADGYMVLVEGEGCANPFSLSLSSQPSANVEVTVSFDQQLHAQGGQPGESLAFTFTPESWGPIECCLIATDDDVIEGLHASWVTLTASSADPDYDGSMETVRYSIRDNEPQLEDLIIQPMGTAGSMLDNGIPAGTPPSALTIGSHTLEAIVNAGDRLTGGCRVLYPNGDPFPNAVFVLYLFRLTADDEDLIYLSGTGAVPEFDSQTETFRYEMETKWLDPGYYAIGFRFADGSKIDTCFEVVAP